MVTVAGAIAALVAAFVVWRIYATVAAGRRADVQPLRGVRFPHPEGHVEAAPRAAAERKS